MKFASPMGILLVELHNESKYLNTFMVPIVTMYLLNILRFVFFNIYKDFNFNNQ